MLIRALQKSLLAAFHIAVPITAKVQQWTVDSWPDGTIKQLVQAELRAQRCQSVAWRSDLWYCGRFKWRTLSVWQSILGHKCVFANCLLISREALLVLVWLWGIENETLIVDDAYSDLLKVLQNVLDIKWILLVIVSHVLLLLRLKLWENPTSPFGSFDART